MEGLAERLTTLGVVLAFWGIAYAVKLFAGFKNVRKQMKNWNWSQFWDGVFDRFCWLIATGGAVVACEMLKWLMPNIGITFSAEVTLLLDTASVIAIPFVNGVADLVTGIQSIRSSTGWDSNVKSLEANLDDMEVKFDQIAKDTWDFLDTITSKTIKEDFEEQGVDEELLEGEVISEEEAGKGGINNTYPNPYRDAAQDTLVDPSTCYNRECVSYCAWKIAELTGKWLTRTGGMNAKDWVARLKENGYGTIVSAPQNGGKYVGVSTAGTYGHVVWFEEGTTISEYNYLTRGGFSVRSINLSAYTWVQIKAPATTTTTTTTATTTTTTTKKSDQEIADEVVAGKWGNGDERKQKLQAAGYNYDTIQAIVNAKLQPTTQPKETKVSATFAVGDTVVPTKLVDYTGHSLVQYDNSYVITQLDGNRAVLSARGQVWAAMNTSSLRKVK